jgi:hypothetical protein
MARLNASAPRPRMKKAQAKSTTDEDEAEAGKTMTHPFLQETDLCVLQGTTEKVQLRS